MATKTISTNEWLISDVKVGDIIPIFTTESINMKVSTQSSGLHRLTVEFTLNFKNQADLIKWEGISTGIRISNSPFYLDLGTDNKWMNPFTNGSPSLVTLTAKVPVGANTMIVTNQGSVSIGNKFQFPGDNKIYIVTDKDTNLITFYPQSRISVEANQHPNFYNPQPLLRLEPSETKISYAAGSKVVLTAKEEV